MNANIFFQVDQSFVVIRYSSNSIFSGLQSIATDNDQRVTIIV
jgi:hypothetical protein